MEGNTNWNTNKQVGESVVNSANDWRLNHEPDLRRTVLERTVEKLTKLFPKHSINRIKETAVQLENHFYGNAIDKVDYVQKINQNMSMTAKRIINGQSGSSVNATNAQDPAAATRVLNQRQSLPTSLPYSQTPTSQQLLPLHSNLNITQSSGLPAPVSTTVSAAQNVNVQMGGGVHSSFLPGSRMEMQGRQELLPQQQQLQNLGPPYMQQQTHPSSLSTTQQSLAQSSPMSGLPSSCQKNSQFLPRPQVPTQRVCASNQQQKAAPSQEHKLMNVPKPQQNHLTLRQNNGDQQGGFSVSSSQQNNTASFQQNHSLPRLPSSHCNNASALPSQQKQHTPSSQSGSFLVPRGTQGQELGQSQPLIYQPRHPMPQKQPQDRTLEKHLDDTQRLQVEGSVRQTQNITDQQNQLHQFQRVSPAYSSTTSQESTAKTVNTSGMDWQEETYQKIKTLREKYFPLLSTMHQRFGKKLREIVSLPQQRMQDEATEKLRGVYSTLRNVILFLNVDRSSISEKHRDQFGVFEEMVLRLTKIRQNLMQQQQELIPPQIHQTSLQSQIPRENDQTKPQLIYSNQNGAAMSQTAVPHSLQTRSRVEPKGENNIMASSGNVELKNLQVVHSDISPVRSMFPQKQAHISDVHKKQEVNHQKQQVATSSHQTNGINTKAELLQQPLSTSQHRQLTTQKAPPAQHRQLTTQKASPAQMQQHSSSQLVYKTGKPTQSGGSPFVTPSSLASFSPSPVPRDPEKPISVQSIQEDPPEPITERPIDRLIKAFQSSSQRSLEEAVRDMCSVISIADRIAGSFHATGGFKAGLPEDLSATTKLHLRTRDSMTQGETNPSKRMRRSIDITSQTDSCRQFSSLEPEADSTASSAACNKANANPEILQPGFALLQEIKEINWRFIETMVNICDEYAASGTIVTCSYAPVALCATFKAHYKSGQLSQIQPLRILVPVDYPHSSPMVLENIDCDASVHNYEDLSARTRSRFGLCVKQLSEPISLKDLARTWNNCARATMAEYAKRHGGGTFSSKYGSWETVLRAS